MKASKYVEERVILAQKPEERREFYRQNNVIAGEDVLEELFYEIKGKQHKSTRFETNEE